MALVLVNECMCMVLLMSRLNLLFQQYNSINGYDFNLANKKFGDPQGSVLGPLLFLIYIKEFKQALRFCKVQHFGNGTNLLHFSKSVNRLDKYVNLDLKNIT